MPTTDSPRAPSALRGEIENVLRDSKAGTARWIASQISRPVRQVRVQLELGGRDGVFTSRITRGGDVLYKLPDANHHRWAALRGIPFTLHR